MENNDQLRIDVRGSLPGGTNSLYGPDGTSLRQLNLPVGTGSPPRTPGGGGGLGSFNKPERRSTVTRP